MTNPLIWMPTLDARDFSQLFFDWQAQRFLKRHGGYGHIISPHKGPWPSFETLAPISGCIWYNDGAKASPKEAKITSTTMEATLAQDTSLPALLQESGIKSLCRVVVKREKDLSLAGARSAIRTSLENQSISIWLDIRTFGWDGASYLAAEEPSLQIAGVADHELHYLTRLAELLERPLILKDLSGRAPKGLLPLPPYADDAEQAQTLKTLPYWIHSR